MPEWAGSPGLAQTDGLSCLRGSLHAGAAVRRADGVERRGLRRLLSIPGRSKGSKVVFRAEFTHNSTLTTRNLTELVTSDERRVHNDEQQQIL